MTIPIRAPSIFPYRSDFFVEVYDVVRNDDGTFVTTATVTINVYDRLDQPIANATNLNGLYDTVNNLYRATIPGNAGVALGQSVRLEVVLTVPPDALVNRVWVDAIVQRYPGGFE